MAEQVKKYRDPVFDMMKGIGILLVLWGHAPGISSFTDTFITSFHMPLFFILSGYFCQTTIDYSNWKQVLKKNFQRLVVPYLLTLCVIAAWFAIFAITKHDYSGLQLVGRKLVGVGDVGWIPIWFLMALFWAKMMFYFISQLRPWLVMVVCTLISLLAVLLHMRWNVNMPLFFLHGCQAMVFIAIGWLYKECQSARVEIPILKKSVVQYVVIGVLFVSWVYQILMRHYTCMFSVEYDCWPLNVLAACGGTYCLYAVCRCVNKAIDFFRMERIRSGLVWIGISSLAILCLHDIELNCSFIRIPLHRVPIIEIYCGTLVRYTITIALVWLLSKWSRYKKIFIG